MVFLFIDGILYPFLRILLSNLVKAQIPTGSMADTIIPFIWFCVAAIGVCVFRCVASVAHLFIFMGDMVSKSIERMIVDITGVELKPGESAVCLGNGEQGFECCCDECDFYLLCFPEIDLENKEEIFTANKVQSL